MAKFSKRDGSGNLTCAPYSSDAVDGKEEIAKLTEYERDYESMSLDPLMLYTLGEMEKLGIRLSNPNATMAVQRIFPKKFTLFGWEGVPDGARATNTLWHLVDKKKKWIVGTVSEYTMTERGRKKLEDSQLMVHKPGGVRSYSKTRKPEKLVEEVKKSNAYKKYKNGEELNEFDLRKVLQCTLDSSQAVLKENYDSLCVHASAAQATEVTEFLNKLKNGFKEIIYA